jgi:hypothetical protein
VKLLNFCLDDEEFNKISLLLRFRKDVAWGSLDQFQTYNFNNATFTHKFLDARHLLTILCGSQVNPNYRSDIKEELIKFIREVTSIKIILQLFTRFKLALYEFTKYNTSTQKYFYTKIINIFNDDLKLDTVNEGGCNLRKYIKLKGGGGKRLLRYGPKGGKYYMKGGQKVYIK